MGLALFTPPEASPCDPELLAAAHPLLAADIQALAPWQPATLPGYRTADITRCERESGIQCENAWRSPAPAPATVLVCGECTSSLDVAWRLQASGLLAPWGSVLALSQRKGRGQLRRAWHSPAGNVYAALALPASFLAAGDMAPLWAGYCLAVALQELGVDVRLKWPNDLLLDDAKVGGVLLEERGGALMAGIGLNLAAAPEPAALQRDSLAPPAGILATAPALGDLGPICLWLKMLPAAMRACSALENASAVEAAGLVESLLAWKGRPVLLRDNSGESAVFDKSAGLIVGIGSDGALRLAHEGGETAIRSGSIALADAGASDSRQCGGFVS